MTLKYNLFGIPGNEQEFEDMVKRKGLSIDIIMGEVSDDYGVGQSLIYQCFPILQAGGKKLSFRNDAKRRIILPGNQGKLERLTTQEQVFNKILYLASHYQSRGFQVTIAGKSVEEAKKEGEQYHLEQKAKIESR